MRLFYCLFSFLKYFKKIQHAGHQARRLILPDPNAPNFQRWQTAIHLQIPRLDPESIIVAHNQVWDVLKPLLLH